MGRDEITRTAMTCDDAQPLLSARLDGELPAADAAALDVHLAGCDGCRAAYAGLRDEDAALRAAFAGRRRAAEALADRVIARLADPTPAHFTAFDDDAIQGGTEGTGARSVRHPASRLRRALVPVLAAAAGFALAALLFRPWRPAVVPPPVVIATQPVPATRPAPVAHLALATGQVDVRPAGAASYFACPTGGPIEAGTRVRTGPKVRCELRMADGSEVRLNDRTELTVAAAGRVEVAAGQVFAVVAKRPAGDPFVVRAAPADVALVALGTGFDVACVPGDPRATLTVVEGAVRVDGPGGGATVTDPAAIVRAGESATLSGGTLRDRRQVRSLATATQWVDEILVLKGRDNPELARRLDDLLAQLGQDKMRYMAAQEVRRLGDHCVVPLTRYIQSDRSKGGDDEARRREAARIVADVSTTASVPELINLLADADGEVRFHAARALERLTGQTQGRPPELWRDQSWMTCVPTAERWHAWWEKNKATLPGCDPDAVRPIQVVKERGAGLGKG